MLARRMNHIANDGPHAPVTGVFKKVERITGQMPDSSVGRAPKVEASRVFRRGIDGAGIGVSGAASLLGVAQSRVSAKVDPTREDASPTLADVITLRDAGGRGLDAARRVIASMLESIEAAEPQRASSPAQLPDLVADMMTTISDVSRTAVRASTGTITPDGRRGVLAAVGKLEALCAAMRAAVGGA